MSLADNLDQIRQYPPTNIKQTIFGKEFRHSTIPCRLCHLHALPNRMFMTKKLRKLPQKRCLVTPTGFEPVFQP